MEQLSFIIYDLLGNMIPGSILMYYFYIKFNDFIDLNFIKPIAGIENEMIVIVVFLLMAYILGNGIDILSGLVCKVFVKEDGEFKVIKMDYETCKKNVKYKSKSLYGFQEKYEAKYLFFRNIFIVSLLILIFEINQIRNYGFIIILIGSISFIRFKKYWKLSAQNLIESYKILKEGE